MKYQATIQFAYDEISSKRLNANPENSSLVDKYKLRENYNDGKVKPACEECGQSLTVASSRNDRIHFRHLPNSKDCYLKESKSISDIRIYNNIQSSKESERHKELKFKIGRKLEKVNGIKNVWVDDRFIFDEKDKSKRKKPDVYCEFHNKKIVFEIQLSELSYKYIRSRYFFYRDNGIFLIWVLEDIEVFKLGKKRMTKDLQYLTEHENLFKFNEFEEKFTLSCSFKDFFIDDRKVKSKWRSAQIGLNNLKFSTPNYQVFYKNGIPNKEIFSHKLQLKIKEDEKRWKEQYNRRIDEEIKEFFNQIRWEWEEPSLERIMYLHESIENFDNFNIIKLKGYVSNKKKNGKPFIHQLILKAESQHLRVIGFMLSNRHDFGIELNEKTDDNESLIQTLAQNQRLGIIQRKYLNLLLNNGCQFSEVDFPFVNQIYNDIFSDSELTAIAEILPLEMGIDVKEIFDNWRFICVLLSIKEKSFIGFNFNEGKWVAFANNAIQHYEDKWIYIKEAMEVYGVWDEVIRLDRKKTFKKKHEKLLLKMPKQSRKLDHLLLTIFPEFSTARFSGKDDEFKTLF